jgi:hypothetical protein
MKFFTPIMRIIENSVTRSIAIRRQKVCMLSLEKQIFNHKPSYYGLLYQNNQNEWRVADKLGMEQIPCGTYTFVRTITGFIRVAPAPQGNTNHLEIADHAAELQFAGEVAFNIHGKMLSWNNKSGNYRPDYHLAAQAGLPLDIFCPIYGDTDSASLQDIQKPVRKRRLSGIGFTTKSYHQANEDDHFAQLRAKKRQETAVIHAQNTENRNPSIKCIA